MNYNFISESNPESADEEEEGVKIKLEMDELTLTTLDLREFEIHPSKRKRRKKRMKGESKIPIEGMCFSLKTVHLRYIHMNCLV